MRRHARTMLVWSLAMKVYVCAAPVLNIQNCELFSIFILTINRTAMAVWTKKLLLFILFTCISVEQSSTSAFCCCHSCDEMWYTSRSPNAACVADITNRLWCGNQANWVNSLISLKMTWNAMLSVFPVLSYINTHTHCRNNWHQSHFVGLLISLLSVKRFSHWIVQLWQKIAFGSFKSDLSLFFLRSIFLTAMTKQPATILTHLIMQPPAIFCYCTGRTRNIDWSDTYLSRLAKPNETFATFNIFECVGYVKVSHRLKFARFYYVGWCNS